MPLEGSASGGGRSWNNAITRRSFLERTGGATAATLVSWHSLHNTARATEPAAGDSGTTTTHRYTFVVLASPEMTNPDQVESGWKNKKIPSTGPQGSNEILGGPWQSGGNVFYANYKFKASGCAPGEFTTLPFGGSAIGKLWEDDPGDQEGNWYADDDDLKAAASVNMSERDWWIDTATGEVHAPVEVLEITNQASPGSGYATAKVSLGEIVFRVNFNYTYVTGWSGGAGGSLEGGEGSAGVDYALGTANEVAFGFVWRIKIRKYTTVKDASGNVISETHTDSNP